ncbi:cilia- and flagella-associated protein 251-like [Silurus meridionalis]|nr:cilia- and flagella-associated protein 251-like [Silurus meridionalis]
MMSDSTEDNTYMVLIVFFILVILVILLLFLYKHLNRETKDKYTIQKLVLGEGGLRDRVMQGIAVVQTRLVELRPPQADEEQALSKNEDGNSGEEKEEGEEEEEEEEESTEQGHSETENIAKAEEEEPHNDSLDNCSSVGLKEGVKQNNSKEEEKKDEKQEKEEGAKDEAKGDDSKQEEVVKDEEKVGLLVDLKPFSGSAIWSEDKTEENNVTAL